MDVDVLCVGHATYDLVLSVDHHPGADEKCFASGFVGAGGGPAANAAVTVARLGGSAAFAGYLGEDHFGNLHLEELRSEGVITDLTARGPHPTVLSSIFVKPDGNRTVVTYKGSTPILEPRQVDFSRIRPKAILFDGHEPEISVPLAKQAKRAGVITILDAGSVHQGTIELAPLCYYLVASEKFARDFTREIYPDEAVKKLARIAPVAIVTMGADGLVWCTTGEGKRQKVKGKTLASVPVNAVDTTERQKAKGKRQKLSAVPVNAVDTTGAGDIFHGAFALRTALRDDLLTALRYASAAAALGCTKMGARPGIPVKSEVDALVKKFWRE